MTSRAEKIAEARTNLDEAENAVVGAQSELETLFAPAVRACGYTGRDLDIREVKGPYKSHNGPDAEDIYYVSVSGSGDTYDIKVPVAIALSDDPVQAVADYKLAYENRQKAVQLASLRIAREKREAAYRENGLSDEQIVAVENARDLLVKKGLA